MLYYNRALIPSYASFNAADHNATVTSDSCLIGGLAQITVLLHHPDTYRNKDHEYRVSLCPKQSVIPI